MRVNISCLVVHLAKRFGAHAYRHIRVSAISNVDMIPLHIKEFASFIDLNQLFQGVNCATCIDLHLSLFFSLLLS